MIHIVKGFGIVNKAEVDVFLELSCFFDNLADVGNLISGSSFFSKSSFNIWKFMVHALWSLAWRILEMYFIDLMLMFWSSDVKNWLIGEDYDAGKDWRQEEKGATEDEMVGCYHWLDGHEFEQAPGVGDGQVSLACCSSWGCKESDMPELLNWTDCHTSMC